MHVNVIGCLYVLESEKNSNIKKNDIKKIKILVDKNNMLPSISFNGEDIKELIKNHLKNIIGSSLFHLEQVYTYSYKDHIDIIYLAVTNIENVIKLDDNYMLINFKIQNNKVIYLEDKIIDYQTIEIENDNNIEYVHDVKIEDEEMKKNIRNMLISYKRIRANIDSTDIIFKFMPKTFTLEDVRIVYEIIKDTSVDKSNFRKKIVKYCEKVEEKTSDKIGYRPSQKYKFKPLKGDIWL